MSQKYLIRQYKYHYDIGNLHLSKKLLVQIYFQDVTNVQVLCKLGNICLDLGQIELAKQCYYRCIIQDRYNVRYHIKLANLYQSYYYYPQKYNIDFILQQLKKAQDYFFKRILYLPTLTNKQIYQIYYYISESYYKNNNLKFALFYAKKSLQISSYRHAAPHILYAKLLLSSDDYVQNKSKILNHFEYALKLKPMIFDYYYEYITTLKIFGHHGHASKVLHQLHSLRNDHAQNRIQELVSNYIELPLCVSFNLYSIHDAGLLVPGSISKFKFIHVPYHDQELNYEWQSSCRWLGNVLGSNKSGYYSLLITPFIRLVSQPDGNDFFESKLKILSYAQDICNVFSYVPPSLGPDIINLIHLFYNNGQNKCPKIHIVVKNKTFFCDNISETLVGHRDYISSSCSSIKNCTITLGPILSWEKFSKFSASHKYLEFSIEIINNDDCSTCNIHDLTSNWFRLMRKHFCDWFQKLNDFQRFVSFTSDHASNYIPHLTRRIFYNHLFNELYS